jgi:hypothetical protein
MPTPPRTLCLLLAAAGLLSACTPHVNLASRRRNYDSLLDLAGRGAAVADQDKALLADLLAHSRTPAANPYPLLGVDVDAMQRQVEALTRSGVALKGMLAELDGLAQGRVSLSPDDGPAWVDYQDVNGRFLSLAEMVGQERAALDDAHQDLQSLMRRYGISDEEAGTLRAECEGFIQALDKALSGMESKVHDERALYENLRLAGGAPRELMRLRRMALDGLEQDLIDGEGFQRRASAAARLYKDGLPASGPLYTGPGLPGDGSALLALRDDQAELDRRQMAFQEECRHFEHIDSEPYYNPPTVDPNPQAAPVNVQP